MNLAIIPARGGSQRIPRKNIRDFRGKPMIAWSIEAARASGLFEHVVVSTDDDEIAEVARVHGAGLADDHTPTRLVVDHAIHAVCRDPTIIPLCGGTVSGLCNAPEIALPTSNSGCLARIFGSKGLAETRANG